MCNARNLICILTCAFLLAAPLIAQEKKSEQPPAGEDETARMMEAWAKIATPGEHHAHLKPLEGKWTVTGKQRMSPEAPWSDHNGACEARWVLGGRFLQQNYTGQAMIPEMPEFEGLGIFGYDNAKQKYTCVWMDNYGTMTMTGEGTCDASGKVITLKFEFDDPFTGSKSWLKSVYRIDGPDKYTMEMHQPTPDGKEFKSLELVHRRRK